MMMMARPPLRPLGRGGRAAARQRGRPPTRTPAARESAARGRLRCVGVRPGRGRPCLQGGGAAAESAASPLRLSPPPLPSASPRRFIAAAGTRIMMLGAANLKATVGFDHASHHDGSGHRPTARQAM